MEPLTSPELFPISQADPEALLSYDEAAQAVGVHVQTLKRWVRQGKFPRPRRVKVQQNYTVQRWTRKPLVLAADVQQFLAAREALAAARTGAAPKAA